jgi:hypothetical protein
MSKLAFIPGNLFTVALFRRFESGDATSSHPVPHIAHSVNRAEWNEYVSREPNNSSHWKGTKDTCF